MFEVFKVMAEKLSSCHMDVVQKLQEIVKDLLKYLDEQKAKHKHVCMILTEYEMSFQNRHIYFCADLLFVYFDQGSC